MSPLPLLKADFPGFSNASPTFPSGTNVRFSNMACSPLRHEQVNDIGAVCRARQIGGHAFPSMTLAKFDRQQLEKRAHVGERLERHDFWDNERPRQRARPIRAGHAAIVSALKQKGRLAAVS